MTKRKIAVILAADVVGYCRLMEADDVRTLRSLNVRRDVFSGLVSEHGGDEFGSVGDSLMAAFSSAVDAVNCSLAIQKMIAKENDPLPLDQRMQLRIGLDLGDVIEQGGKLYGDGLNVAARLQAIADPGGICISGSIYDQVKRKVAARFLSTGMRRVKHIQEPVRTYKVVDAESGTVWSWPWSLRRTALIVAGATVVAVIMAFLAIFEPSIGPSSTPRDKSIAVLPLINMSAIPDNAYFAGGVHEELLTNLARIEGLRVVSRTTALRYINTDLSLRDIGRELDARYIVEGSVRRINNHVRITVQLVDAAEDAHLWSSNYDRELVDVFATQSEVAREITNSLHLEIQPETVGTLDDMPTRSVKAYDLYIKARSIERSEVLSEDALRRQREYLESAVTEDPNFVEAWAYLKRVLDAIVIANVVRGWFGETESAREAYLADVVKDRQRALDRALALDPDNIETILAQASEDYIAGQKGLRSDAERKTFIDRALDMNPNLANAWRARGWYLRKFGSRSAASAAFLKALELDPLNAGTVEAALFHFRHLGDEEMTAQLYETLTQIAPKMGNDKSLAAIPSAAKLDNILALFTETADESLIETYSETLATELENLTSRWPSDKLDWHRANLMVLRNDLDSLADLRPAAPPEAAVGWAKHNYIWANSVVLAAQNLAGRLDDAMATAQRSLTALEELGWDFEASGSEFALPAVAAFATLGNDEMLREMRRVLDDDGIRASSLDGSVYTALAYIDRDAAVELLLEDKAKRPAWYGMDILARNHILSRHLIIHPDIQAFYAEDGKWVDYLAARVPEYAKYRQ